jgi:hypothetical protein
MTTLIHCPTNTAVLLFGLKRDDGVIVFPSDSVQIPGIVSPVNPSLPINPQLLELAHRRSGIPMIEISVWQEFQETVKLPGGDSATLYAAKALIIPQSLPGDVTTLPQMLRSMPPDRNRVAYMKALQVFAGGLEEQTKAVDLEEVRRHFNGLNGDQEH